MIRDFVLAAGEEIRWEGRPAPRCYTFRHWRHSIFGIIFLALTSCWQILGIEMANAYNSVYLAWLPLPFLLIGFYCSFGHLLQARLEWNHVYYAITDYRLLIQHGLIKRRVESMNLIDITYFRLDFQGEELGTLHIYKDGEQKLILHCIEYPRQVAPLLEMAVAKNTHTTLSQ
jgi:hypothetical protein